MISSIAFIVAAIVSAIATIGAGIMNNRAINKTNEANVENQNAINQQNIDAQWEMWNATNEYNHPKADMQRKLEAGLNPNLIYGQSNTTSPVNVGLAQSTSIIPKDFSFLSDSIDSITNGFLNANQAKINTTEYNTKVEQLNQLYQLSAFNSEDYQNKLNISSQQAELVKKQVEKLQQDIQIGEFEKASAEAESIVKTINAEYDSKLYEQGLPPDMDSNTRMVVGVLGMLIEKLSGQRLKAEDVFKFIFNT